MTEGAILRDLVVLFATALPIVYVFQRLNVPSVVGFLIAGIVIGPNGAGLIATNGRCGKSRRTRLGPAAFCGGLELSLAPIGPVGAGHRLVRVRSSARYRRARFGVALLLGLSPSTALLLGFLLAQSSTAIV